MANSTWLRLGIFAGTLAAFVYVARSLWSVAAFVLDIIVTLFLAWIVAAAIRRFVRVVRRHLRPNLVRLAVPTAYLVIILVAVAIASLVIPLTIVQALDLADDLPIYTERVVEAVGQAQEWARNLGLVIEIPGVEQGQVLNQVGAAVSQWVSQNSLGIVQRATAIVFQVFVVFILSVYMVVDGDRLLGLFYRLLPVAYHRTARGILRRMDHVFFSYLKGVSLIGVLYSFAVTLIMLVADLPFALPLGLSAGFIQLVPVLGEVVALGIPIIVAILTKPLSTAVAVTVVTLAFSLVMNNFVSPRILGKAVDMPGILVILAILIGTRIAGIWGALLGVPVTAFLYSLTLAWAERGKANNGTGNGQSITEQPPERQHEGS